MSNRRCVACNAPFIPYRPEHRYCSHQCGTKATLHDRSLPIWNWQADPITVAWRDSIVATIEAERAAPSEPVFHCGACGSHVPINDLIERRRIA